MLATIVYSSNASITRVTLLHFVNLVCTMLPVKVNCAFSTILALIANIKLICELKFLLLVKEPFIKT